MSKCSDGGFHMFARLKSGATKRVCMLCGKEEDKSDAKAPTFQNGRTEQEIKDSESYWDFKRDDFERNRMKGFPPRLND